MCLSSATTPTDKVKKSTIIGYRAAYTCCKGQYQSCHQQTHKRLKVGVELKATGPQDTAGFHIFRNKRDAQAYAKGNGDCVLKVKCTDIWRVGRHSTGSYGGGMYAEAFTCGKMTILEQVNPEPPTKVWQQYQYGTYGTYTVSARKPSAKVNQVEARLHDTFCADGKDYCAVTIGKAKTPVVVRFKKLWELKEV